MIGRSIVTRPLYDIHNLAHAPLSSLQRVRVGDGEFDCELGASHV
jgi:hypothetical protein